MSNLPVVAAFLPLADQIVKLFPEGEERRKTACAFILGVPIAGMSGGMITPAGAAINVLIMERLQSAGDIMTRLVKEFKEARQRLQGLEL